MRTRPPRDLAVPAIGISVNLCDNHAVTLCAMNSHVKFSEDITTLSPSASPDGKDGNARTGAAQPEPPAPASRLPAGAKMWVPVLLELRLRCERTDSDGTCQCVWVLQDDDADAEFSFESLYFKGSKSDEKTPVVQQYAQSGNFWCLMQRNDSLALGAKGTGTEGWVMVTSTDTRSKKPKGGGSAKGQALNRYVASLPLPSDYPDSITEIVAQIRVRTRPFYSTTSICEGLSPDSLPFSAPRRDEAPYDHQEDNDFITLTQRLPLSALSVDATKSNVTLHLFNGRLSVRMLRVADSKRWLVQALRIIARIVPSTATRQRPASTGSGSAGSLTSRSAPRTPSTPAVVAANEVQGAGVFGNGVPGWRGKFLRAVRKATRLRVCKLLEVVAGVSRVNVRSVEIGVKSLHTTGMFVLDSVDTVFLWLGSNTGKKQNVKAEDFVKKYPRAQHTRLRRRPQPAPARLHSCALARAVHCQRLKLTVSH